MIAEFNNKGNLVIGTTEINDKVYQEELTYYWLVDREDQIDHLYIWIGEATGSDRRNDLYMMKEDLRYLESLSDKFVFSSYSTNEFIAKSDNEEQFNDICKEILKKNEEVNRGDGLYNDKG